MCMLKAHNPDYFKDQPLRTRSLSDHLAILMSIDFDIIKSERTPRIDKTRMLKKIDEMTR